MARLLALLRGVNVGGKKKVPMAALRALAERIGFAAPRTYIQSGNLVVEAAGVRPGAAAAKLEAAIEQEFGFPVAVVARSPAQWARYAAGSPFPGAQAAEPKRLLLCLAKEAPAKDAAKVLAARATAGEGVAAAGDALWIHYPAGIGASKLTPGLIDRAVGAPVTTRNWTTVLALDAMLRA